MAATHTIVPLHLSGITTEQQKKLLKDCLDGAVRNAYLDAIEQLDRQSAQAVLELEDKLKSGATKTLVELVLSHTVSHKFEDEEAPSDRQYPPTYRVRPVEAQATELRKAFPGLGGCREKLGRLALPDEPEAWFAIPR